MSLNMTLCHISYSEDADEMPHFVASHLGLHCLVMSHLWGVGKNGLKSAVLY